MLWKMPLLIITVIITKIPLTSKKDATADDVEDMEDYNVFVHSNKDSKDSGAPLAFASFCDDYPNREWTIFHI